LIINNKQLKIKMKKGKNYVAPVVTTHRVVLESGIAQTVHSPLKTVQQEEWVDGGTLGGAISDADGDIWLDM
jgi:hypothetical protein